MPVLATAVSLKDVRWGLAPTAAELPIPCISLSPWRSEQPGSVTDSVPKKTMQPAAIIGGIAGAAGVAAAGTGLLLGNTTTRFLLFKSVPGHGEIFEEVSESELQPGDVLLFPMDRSNNTMVQVIFKHAAVYCGNGEVIHFLGTDTPNSSGHRSISKSRGQIVKSGYKALRNERGQCQIYRKKGGVDLNDFHSRVRRAMNSKAEYNACTNNCIHFALSLLGLEEFSSQLVQIQDEGGRSRSGGADV
ncbi:uncharacterized protein LOC135992347 [Caloenas nicobarica]|uniref:uncharacterized protein LOC135992347 n=1 Tax=Caloenas nicobarica TaxID=187106 RepID=UPI0032B863C3